MRVMLVVVCLALTAGCKKTYTPFYELESRQSVLISQDGDDAYLSAELEEVVKALEAVPDNAREKERAVALVATLRAEQRRVKAEQAPAPQARPEVVEAPSVFDAPVVVEAVPALEAVVDAGDPVPYAGMDEKTFVRLFGACFAAGAPSRGEDGGVATAQVVLADAGCVKRFGTVGATTTYLFMASALVGTRTETVTVTVVDAGPAPVPVAPPAPVVVDAGEARVLRIPGVPSIGGPAPTSEDGG